MFAFADRDTLQITNKSESCIIEEVMKNKGFLTIFTVLTGITKYLKTKSFKSKPSRYVIILQ
jgi:hypothetical protein